MKSQKRASTATTSINDQQTNSLFIFTPTIVLIGSGALDSSGSCKLYQILCSIFLALVHLPIFLVSLFVVLLTVFSLS